MPSKIQHTHNLVIPLKDGLVKIKCAKVVSNILLLTQKEDYMVVYESCKKWLDENNDKINNNLNFDLASLSSLSLEHNFAHGIKANKNFTDSDPDIQRIVGLINENYDKKSEKYDVDQLKKS